MAIFSGNLFDPLRSILLDEKNFGSQFLLLWLKKYFFSDRLPQKYTIYTFNSSIFDNYTYQLDKLILNTAITDKIFFEEEIKGLPYTLIQDFFLLNKKFISASDFDVKDFFSFYQSRLTFRSERIESHFFKLSSKEKMALQQVLKDHSIVHESYDFVFSNLLNKGHDLSLQIMFLKLYGERIIEKIRIFPDIDQLSFHDTFDISFKIYLEIMDVELANVRGNLDYFLHMFQTIRASFDQIPRLTKRSFFSILGKFFQFMGTAAIAPFISSLPYVIRAISKVSRAYDAFDEILSATAPWLDFLIHKIFDNVYRLPPGIARHIVNYIERCDTCSALGGRIAKNFPLFSFFILLKSLKELMVDCQNDNKNIISFYCMNMIVNQILSVALIGVEVHYADHIRYVFPHYLSAVFLLTGHGLAFETYRHYSEIYDKWNLAIHPLEERIRVYFGLAVGVYSPNDPNYATLGISAPQQVFAAFENFVDSQRDERKVYIYRAAIMVPHVSVVERKKLPLKENKQGINSTSLFKIDKLANFEFIFGINQTFCHDASIITITPEHKKEFEKEYRIALGTFTGFPDQETGICAKGSKITSDSLAKASDASSASILANSIFPENTQAHEKLHYSSNRVLFALADPAAVANYSLRFTDEYRGEFDFITLMLKRLLVLESPATDNNIARFAISGLKSVDTGKFKTIAYIIASVSWIKTEIIIEAIESISLMQEFHFHRLEGKHTFYFDGESLATKNGFTIVNLKKSKKIAFNMGEHLFSTENKVITIPCGKIFHALHLAGVSREERVSLGRLDCG